MNDQQINQTLQERERRYGPFAECAEIAQGIKKAMQRQDGWLNLADDQCESLEMMASKIGRILNGNPDYVDSWLDIAGFATLVARRLSESGGTGVPDNDGSGKDWADLMASAGSDYQRAEIGCVCPADVPGATWFARVAVQKNDVERARLGQHCPAGVEGATWDARMALQKDDYDRAMLGQHCPAGVEGATWEAREAVQRDDEDRAWLWKHCPAYVPGDPRYPAGVPGDPR